MPTLSHVTPNEPATNYRWRGVWTAGGGAIGTIGVRAFAGSVITWGIAFPAEGISVVGYAYDPAVGSAGGEIRFTSPWFADQLVTLLSYTGGTWEVEIDDLALTRTACVGYSWSYSEIRLYINGVLIYTGGANAGGGTGYDHRYNRCRLYASTEYDPSMVCNPASCPGATLTIWPTSRLVGGYQRDTGSGWFGDGVLIDPTGFTTPLSIPTCPGACTCFPTAPAITGTDSYAVEVYGERKYLSTAATRSHDCYCKDGSFGGSVTEYQVDEDTYDDSTWVHVVGEEHGIRRRVIIQRSCCNCVCPAYTDAECRITTTTTPSSKTYCESYRSSTGWKDTVYCWSGMVICPEPPGGGDGAGRCGQSDDIFCAFDAYVHVYWPDDTCGESSSGPHNSRDKLGRYTRTAVRDGQLWLLRADSGSPREGWDLETLWGENISQARTMWRPDLTLRLIYRDSSDGHVYWSRSTDDGVSFEDPELLFMSAHYPEPMQNGLGWEVFAVFKYDSGSSGPGKIFLRVQPPDENIPGAEFSVKDAAGVPIAFAADSFGIEAPPNGPSRWVLTAMADGATEPGEWESTDEGVSWEPV